MINTRKLVHFGPGGIGCPCCTPFGSAKKNKRYANRKIRQALKAEMEEEEVRTIQWYNYWDTYYSPEEDEDWRQENENIQYYRSHLEGRDTVEDSSVYSKNTYEW